MACALFLSRDVLVTGFHCWNQPEGEDRNGPTACCSPRGRLAARARAAVKSWVLRPQLVKLRGISSRRASLCRAGLGVGGSRSKCCAPAKSCFFACRDPKRLVTPSPVDLRNQVFGDPSFRWERGPPSAWCWAQVACVGRVCDSLSHAFLASVFLISRGVGLCPPFLDLGQLCPVWSESGGRRGPAPSPALTLGVRILPGKLKINSVLMCKATAKAALSEVSLWRRPCRGYLCISILAEKNLVTACFLYV